jgi:hypothetical protein
MSYVRARAVLLAAILCGTANLYATSPATLTMTANASTVTVAGATPHGKVVFFAVARFIDGTMVTIRRLDQTVTDDDGDGVVTFSVGAPVPWKAIFAAVDFASGRFILATPNAAMFPLLQFQVDTPSISDEGAGVLKHIVANHCTCEMLHVRPNVGAWSQILAKGNKFDENQGIGVAKANVAAGHSVDAGNQAAPDHFENGDVIILIDRMRMQSWATTVGAN